MADDDTTKLVIYGLGIAAVVFFAYMIFRDSRMVIPQSTKSHYGFMQESSNNLQSSQESKPSELKLIEQRLIQLELKLDNLAKTNYIQKQSTPQVEQSERNKASLSKPVAKRLSNPKEFFGMQ